MNFEEVKTFIISKMKMSQIYQPFLIKSLIEFGGSSTIRQLASLCSNCHSMIHKKTVILVSEMLKELENYSKKIRSFYGGTNELYILY